MVYFVVWPNIKLFTSGKTIFQIFNIKDLIWGQPPAVYCRTAVYCRPFSLICYQLKVKPAQSSVIKLYGRSQHFNYLDSCFWPYLLFQTTQLHSVKRFNFFLQDMQMTFIKKYWPENALKPLVKILKVTYVKIVSRLTSWQIIILIT